MAKVLKQRKEWKNTCCASTVPAVLSPSVYMKFHCQIGILALEIAFIPIGACTFLPVREGVTCHEKRLHDKCKWAKRSHRKYAPLKIEHLKHACFSTFHAWKLLSCMYHAWNITAMHKPWLVHAWGYETCMNHTCFKITYAYNMRVTGILHIKQAWNFEVHVDHACYMHITSHWLEVVALQVWNLIVKFEKASLLKSKCLSLT